MNKSTSPAFITGCTTTHRSLSQVRTPSGMAYCDLWLPGTHNKSVIAFVDVGQLPGDCDAAAVGKAVLVVIGNPGFMDFSATMEHQAFVASRASSRRRTARP